MCSNEAKNCNLLETETLLAISYVMYDMYKHIFKDVGSELNLQFPNATPYLQKMFTS